MIQVLAQRRILLITKVIGRDDREDGQFRIETNILYFIVAC